MTYDFNAAGGEALLEQLVYDHHERYSYPAVSSAAPSQDLTSTALATMSQANRLSLSPGTTWLPLDLTGAGSAPVSIHSPNSASATASSPDDQSAQSPGHQSAMSSPLQQQQHSPFQPAAHPNPSGIIPDWSLPLQAQQQPTPDLAQFIQDSALMSFNPFQSNFPPAPLEYLPATTQATLEASLQLEPTFNTMSPIDGASRVMQWGAGMANWQDFDTAINFQHDGLSRVRSLGSHSPTGTYLEVLSLGSSSDNGWAAVDAYPNCDTFQQSQHSQTAAIFNPSQTLHLRNNSDSTSDSNSLEFGSYEEVTFPYSPFSPGSDTFVDPSSNHRNCLPGEHHHQPTSTELISPSAAVAPLPIKTVSATNRPIVASGSSGSGSTSPPARRNSGTRKSPIAKATKPVIRRSSTGKKDGTGEKKVGRRRGPLLPEQRKQASEIRKLRACLRCKFLKKTCDKGEPCAGCQPSHARLWQVPCTRIDIKDIGYFMKDWKADYERHLDRGMSVFNVKGFAQKETLMWITHGYGFCLPVMVREVYVADDSCFQVDWVESTLQDQDPIDFEIRTERLDVGQEGISTEALSEYLDKHIDEGFEQFIDDHFEGTPFITEIFKTAYRFYTKERLPVIRKALKLVVAYNLTLHITMIEQPTEEPMEGHIDDEDSKYYGKVIAPVMINFQIKCAMADMWRELQKDILEELSALYSSVYSGERLKNWPTIFMLASILLAVWEEIQFDCHYRVPDPVAVEKFCNDMETVPVGVIVGLFHAISQKLPAFTEWDTRRHGQLLNNNPAVCEAMTEVRQHVIKHESYLRTRADTKFDRYDFDSLSNKLLSKLVIRAN
ncbi:C6 finger domain-containing protein [Madurella fahalii]|uniref:C6 finger domain-containing protein n=1 Tax=Madurella fahalii TaxID=1157608 RepID=A0ABQ0GDH3_9PEZI